MWVHGVYVGKHVHGGRGREEGMGGDRLGHWVRMCVSTTTCDEMSHLGFVCMHTNTANSFVSLPLPCFWICLWFTCTCTCTCLSRQLYFCFGVNLLRGRGDEFDFGVLDSKVIDIFPPTILLSPSLFLPLLFSLSFSLFSPSPSLPSSPSLPLPLPLFPPLSPASSYYGTESYYG